MVCQAGAISLSPPPRLSIFTSLSPPQTLIGGSADVTYLKEPDLNESR
jgi:hypothetical protein